MQPTIKGIFVNSHVAAVRAQKGEDGVRELEKRFGKPVSFKNFEDVPVADEIKVIEFALDILQDKIFPSEERAFEAGRLHFRNFTTTPLAKVVFMLFTNPKETLLRAKGIAEQVFQGITFSSYDMGGDKLRVVMEGGVYPLEHFRGLMWEWIKYFEYEPTVTARQLGPEKYEYILEQHRK